jgi:hypothetical protein
MAESPQSEENATQAKTTEETTQPEKPAAKLTPLQAIRQAQAARQQNSGSGKGGGNKGHAHGQGGAAASRKPTTGRQSYGGNS